MLVRRLIKPLFHIGGAVLGGSTLQPPRELLVTPDGCTPRPLN